MEITGELIRTFSDFTETSRELDAEVTKHCLRRMQKATDSMKESIAKLKKLEKDQNV